VESSPLFEDRKQTRLPGYDYRAAGAYHCTIVTLHRKCILSRVVEAHTELLPLGLVVQECLEELPQRFEHVQLDCFEIMPNHIHALLVLSGRVPEWKQSEKPGTQRGSLSEVIQALKSRVAIRGKLLGYSGIFQRGFHEHIIRDEQDLYATRKYISENPLKWHLDRENPDKQES
jgi:REP element-mobilizing transposase RayT